MRKWRNDFKASNNSDREAWYDLEEDWETIASSLKTQYGYSIRKEIDNLSWAEFCSDVSGLMSETPLGNLVQIRSEDNKDVLKNFTKEQKEIRSKYREKMAKKISKEEFRQVIEEFQKAFKEMAGGGK